jgi:segregation and condensation protein B
LQPDALAGATGAELHEVVAALERLREHHEFERPGLVLRDIGGSWPLSSHQDGEPSARRLLARPRIPALTPAGPCRDARDHRLYAAGVPGRRSPGSRGPNAESVAATLLERGLVEEAGRPQFGGVLYRSAKLFLKPFGLRSLDELPDLSAFDPSPELEAELRARLSQPGEARAGV